MDPDDADGVLAWLPASTELQQDVTPADWIVERLRPWGTEGARLESFAPSGFESYARVFHPARDPAGGRARWSGLAKARGIELTPDVGFLEVSGIALGDARSLDDVGPSDGRLPPDVCDVITSVLLPYTGTPDRGWMCLWDGWGALWSGAHATLASGDIERGLTGRRREAGLAQDAVLRATPRVRTQHREYFLFLGPLAAASGFEPEGWHLSPSLWWPDDRAWIVVTEIDGYSTYVGGSAAAVEDLVRSATIEAIPVTLDVRMDPGPYR